MALEISTYTDITFTMADYAAASWLYSLNCAYDWQITARPFEVPLKAKSLRPLL